MYRERMSLRGYEMIKAHKIALIGLVQQQQLDSANPMVLWNYR